MKVPHNCRITDIFFSCNQNFVWITLKIKQLIAMSQVLTCLLIFFQVYDWSLINSIHFSYFVIIEFFDFKRIYYIAHYLSFETNIFNPISLLDGARKCTGNGSPETIFLYSKNNVNISRLNFIYAEDQRTCHSCVLINLNERCTRGARRRDYWRKKVAQSPYSDRQRYCTL